MENKIAAHQFKNDPHDPMTAMLDDALALASVGVAALKMLESLLPSAAGNVELASKTLVEHFMVLAENAKDQGMLIAMLIAKIRKMDPENDETAAIDRRAKECRLRIDEAAAAMVVAMQFQDRNTQITENAASVLQRYGSMLADIRDRITVARAGGASIDAGVYHATNAILAEICISDIRKHFIDALADVSLQCERGHLAPVVDQESNTNIELF